MENNDLYITQLYRRLYNNLEDLKSLNNKLKTNSINIEEIEQAIRKLELGINTLRSIERR